jgi:homeobox protein cut-like
MEGGVDMEETVETPPAAESQTPVAGEQEEGNKFQKAIGAWRSTIAICIVSWSRLTMARH